MTVRELINILQKTASMDAEVIISSDEEGNSYRIANVSVDEWGRHNDFEVEVLVPEDIAETEEDFQNGIGEVPRHELSPMVVIW